MIRDLFHSMHKGKEHIDSYAINIISESHCQFGYDTHIETQNIRITRKT